MEYEDGAPDEMRLLDALVERLRDLEWPKPPPGMRERTLGEIERVVFGTADGGAAAGGDL
jgi:hypothetical protein